MSGPAHKAQAWESRSLGSRFQHEIFYALLRFGGMPLGKFLLFWVVLYYTLAPHVRGRIRPYLERRFGPAGYGRRTGQTFRLYMQFGLVLLERAATGILGHAPAKGGEMDDARLLDALNEGKGVIMLSAHVGAWQTAPSGLGFVGKKVYLVHRRIKGDVDRHYFEQHSRAGQATAAARPEVGCIDPAGPFGGLVDMLARLREGNIVCLMGDRLPAEEHLAVPVRFLGSDILVPATPYLLASRSGSPLVLAFTFRTGEGRVLCQCPQVLHIPAGLPKTAEAVRPYAQLFADALEALVMERPYQFFNFYDLWKPRGNDA